PGRRVVVVEPVPAGTAVNLVVAGASTEVVGTAETGDRVVAAFAVKPVGLRRACQRVVELRPVDEGHADERVVAPPGRGSGAEVYRHRRGRVLVVGFGDRVLGALDAVVAGVTRDHGEVQGEQPFAAGGHDQRVVAVAPADQVGVAAAA